MQKLVREKDIQWYCGRLTIDWLSTFFVLIDARDVAKRGMFIAMMRNGRTWAKLPKDTYCSSAFHTLPAKTWPFTPWKVPFCLPVCHLLHANWAPITARQGNGLTVKAIRKRRRGAYPGATWCHAHIQKGTWRTYGRWLAHIQQMSRGGIIHCPAWLQRAAYSMLRGLFHNASRAGTTIQWRCAEACAAWGYPAACMIKNNFYA